MHVKSQTRKFLAELEDDERRRGAGWLGGGSLGGVMINFHSQTVCFAPMHLTSPSPTLLAAS